MKKIPLTKGQFTFVDDEDFDYLNQWKWYCNSYGYAVREQNIGRNKSTNVFMHRIINNTPRGLDTDHVNHNPLDNRKTNLRTVTHTQNMYNLKISKTNTSGYKGVSWHKETKKWRSYVSIKGKQIYLGLFSHYSEAIEARKRAEEMYYVI